MLNKPKATVETIKFRPSSKIDSLSLSKDLFDSVLMNDPPVDINTLVDTYDSELQHLLDAHAPEREKQSPKAKTVSGTPQNSVN